MLKKHGGYARKRIVNTDGKPQLIIELNKIRLDAQHVQVELLHPKGIWLTAILKFQKNGQKKRMLD
jgi:hypothetical protein